MFVIDGFLFYLYILYCNFTQAQCDGSLFSWDGQVLPWLYIYTCLGIAKLLTPGVIGVWWIVVFLLLTRNVNQTAATPGNNFTDSLHCAFTRFLCVHYLVHGYPYTVYKLQKRREREKTMYG